METKICKNCNIEKEINEFPKTGKLCRICFNEYMRGFRKKYKEKYKSVVKAYYENNKKQISSYQKDYHKKKYIENKDKIKLDKKRYYDEKLDKNKRRIYAKNYMKERYKQDIIFRLNRVISSNVRISFSNSGYKKNSKTYNILGCSFEEFKIYLESKFENWMTWDNQGKYNGEFEYGWDIDHIEPLFPEGVERTEEDIVRLNHYTNLQPLCSKINREIKKNYLNKDSH